MKFALIGHKISYSMSPVIHELISEIPMDYKILDLSPESLSKELPPELLELNGFNVTIPHKRSIMAYCKELDPVAEIIAAVNTVDNTNGVLKGYNTDYLGFMSSLRESIKNYFDFHPVLIGYGGVARAVIFALQEMGFRTLSIAGGIDDNERKVFIDEMNSQTKIILIDHIPDLPCLWINATPIGGAKYPDIPKDYIPFRYGDILFDLNYTPYPTFLEQYAKKKGIKTLNGLNMLVYQAIEAQKIWFKDKQNTRVDVNSIIHSLVNLNTVS
ncbi:MAG: shikimate dehydrogenase [Candidatus Neomarinimicrobiota bacterium]|jgi:shikimate dehydrogenase